VTVKPRGKEEKDGVEKSGKVAGENEGGSGRREMDKSRKLIERQPISKVNWMEGSKELRRSRKFSRASSESFQTHKTSSK